MPIVEREIALATERVERRLTTILAADVAGYSRLTGLDEEGTHAQLQDHLRSLVNPKIVEHRGRVVKNTGDGLLAEFSSVVDAVRCAVDVQRGIAERNAGVPQEKRIEFRIGVNVGDIIIDCGDIFGDGVNVAARLEGVAEPGGICVSGQVMEHIEGKLDISFDDAGEQALKNIARPVRVYRARPNAAGAKHASLGTAQISRQLPSCRSRTSVSTLSRSILRTEWWKTSPWRCHAFAGLFVIARNSSFTYKGRAVDVKQVGRELGVRYVLEGSVRKAGTGYASPVS